MLISKKNYIYFINIIIAVVFAGTPCDEHFAVENIRDCW